MIQLWNLSELFIMRANPRNLDIHTMSNSAFLYAQIAMEYSVNMIN